MNIVIGSGPSGIACAAGLRAAGAPVLILDAGLDLEAERIAGKQALAARDSAEWAGAAPALFPAPTFAPGAVPDKLCFGSNFPYRPFPGAAAAMLNATGLKPSFAAGGLSSVWGAAVMPWQASDLAKWPIGRSDLEEGYRAVALLMPMAAVEDDLAESFPLYGAPHPPPPISRQAATVLCRLERNKGALKAKGLAFGRSRLAMEGSACVACGLCLRGCPLDLIHSTRAALATLQTGGAAYRSGVLALAVEETPTGIVVRTQAGDGATESIEGERVFLAAGVVNTTEILLRSMGWFNRPVEILDAQYFLIPVAQISAAADARRERLHTLSQAFLELDDPAVSAHTVHLQLYTYNDMIAAAVDAKFGPLGGGKLADAVIGRLMVLQGYLHSDQSGRIEARLNRGGGMVLTGRPAETARKGVSALVAKLMRLTPLTGLLPLTRLVEITEPGRGFHCGGAFPMSHSPRIGECDIFGRPHGFSRIHVTDSSTLPSIPAPTITFSVMANAWRIGAAATRNFLR